jgi:hypothetical protein
MRCAGSSAGAEEVSLNPAFRGRCLLATFRVHRWHTPVKKAGLCTFRPQPVYDGEVIVDRLDIGAEEFEHATGWEIKPEGACKADVCVPLPDGGFDLMAAAQRLGMAVVAEPSQALWAVGPETLGGRTLVTADASDFVLPDLDGNVVRMASLRNQKVLVVAWAPY